MLTPKDYNDALQVQDAVNLSGVVKSFSEVLLKIWDEARELGKGTDYVNHHPVSVLYSSKITSLTDSENSEFFSISYNICLQEAKKEE
ncbi:MAG: hypothetical protein WC346_17320 [Methanogenium sp.]|jgi:hypothetical protein